MNKKDKKRRKNLVAPYYANYDYDYFIKPSSALCNIKQFMKTSKPAFS